MSRALVLLLGLLWIRRIRPFSGRRSTWPSRTRFPACVVGGLWCASSGIPIPLPDHYPIFHLPVRAAIGKTGGGWTCLSVCWLADIRLLLLKDAESDVSQKSDFAKPNEDKQTNEGHKKGTAIFFWFSGF